MESGGFAPRLLGVSFSPVALASAVINNKLWNAVYKTLMPYYWLFLGCRLLLFNLILVIVVLKIFTRTKDIVNLLEIQYIFNKLKHIIVLWMGLDTHLQVAQLTVIISDWHCPICSKGFSVKGSVKEHIKTVHQKLRNFGCKYCGKTFGHKCNQIRHERQFCRLRLWIQMYTNWLITGLKYLGCSDID